MNLREWKGHSIGIVQDGKVKAHAKLLGDVDGTRLRLPGGRGWVKVGDIEGAKIKSTGKKKKVLNAVTLCFIDAPSPHTQRFDLDSYGLKDGGLKSGKEKWVVSNLAGTQTFATLGVTQFVPCGCSLQHASKELTSCLLCDRMQQRLV
jgi:hypothetical protein